MANSYTPHTWVTKEIITSDLLNHMEQGIQTAMEAANEAASMQELRSAFDLLSTETRAVLRALEQRVSALESN